MRSCSPSTCTPHTHTHALLPASARVPLACRCQSIPFAERDLKNTLSEYFGVRGIPTLMMFKNGELAAQKVGAAPKGALQQWVEDHI